MDNWIQEKIKSLPILKNYPNNWSIFLSLEKGWFPSSKLRKLNIDCQNICQCSLSCWKSNKGFPSHLAELSTQVSDMVYFIHISKIDRLFSLAMNHCNLITSLLRISNWIQFLMFTKNYSGKTQFFTLPSSDLFCWCTFTCEPNYVRSCQSNNGGKHMRSPHFHDHPCRSL